MPRPVRVVLTLITSIVAGFWLVDRLPGDAATSSTPTTDAAVLGRRRTELGLDRPAPERFADWLLGIASGDPGVSATGVPVGELLSEPLSRTALLLAVATPVAVLVGIGGGILAGYLAGSRTDRSVSLLAAILIATPEFVVVIVLVTLLSGRLDLLPPVSLIPLGGTPADNPRILVLPALTIGLAVGAWLQRMTRAVVTAEAARPHVRAARTVGLHPILVLTRHLLPGTAGPIIQLCALAVPGMVGAALIAEVAFGYAGAGQMLVTLIAARDTVPVATLVAAAATLTAVCLLVADLVTGTRPRQWSA